MMWMIVITAVVDCILCFFFFNDTATTEIYTLSLHDALPIYRDLLVRCEPHPPRGVRACPARAPVCPQGGAGRPRGTRRRRDRKSTRLNSSHANISYAVFCLKKKKHLTTLNLTYESCTSSTIY